MIIEAKDLFAVEFDPVLKTVKIKGVRKYNATIRSITNVTHNLVIYNSKSIGDITYSGDDLLLNFSIEHDNMSADDNISAILYISDNISPLHIIDSLRLREAYLVEPNDLNDIPQGFGFIMVLGDAGNVELVTASGQTLVIPLDKKEIIPLLVRRVKSTLTTATVIYMVR